MPLRILAVLFCAAIAAASSGCSDTAPPANFKPATVTPDSPKEVSAPETKGIEGAEAVKPN